MPTRRSSATYEVRAIIDAPLPYVFRWCTDYTAGDPKLERDQFERRILKRTAHRVVYEDLYPQSTGWFWSRQTVTLHPPDRWHLEARGNYRSWSLDYTLKALSDSSTQLTLHGKRTPTEFAKRNPPRATVLLDLRTIWKNYGRALERDYRAGRPARGARR